MRCTESEKLEFLCYSLFITSSANSFSLYAPDLIFTSVFFSFILERWNISLHVFTNYLSLHTRDNNVWFFFNVGIKDITFWWHLVYMRRRLTSIFVFFYVDERAYC